MLGQIANFSPINRSTIVKSSTSLGFVWKAIRQHLGLQASGARILELSDMSLKSGERHEDLYQRLLAFVDDNLLHADSDLTHDGERLLRMKKSVHHWRILLLSTGFNSSTKICPALDR